MAVSRERRIDAADKALILTVVALLLFAGLYVMKGGMMDARVHRTLALRFQAMARVFGQCGMMCEQRYFNIMNAERMN